jgi:hypothetical protein
MAMSTAWIEVLQALDRLEGHGRLPTTDWIATSAGRSARQTGWLLQLAQRDGLVRRGAGERWSLTDRGRHQARSPRAAA